MSSTYAYTALAAIASEARPSLRSYSCLFLYDVSGCKRTGFGGELEKEDENFDEDDTANDEFAVSSRRVAEKEKTTSDS